MNKLAHFIVHSKAATYIAALLCVVVGIVQMISRPSYDTSICLASTYRMNKEERAEFEKLITRICPEDFNGD